MWKFFKRLFRIFSAEAHSVADKLEDPIKMTKQGIRDLKTDLDSSLKSLAEVKAIAIRSKRETSKYKQNASDYEKKAMALLQKAQAGHMDMGEAERLAAEALTRKEENAKLHQTSFANQQKYDGMVSNMESKIKRLKSNVAKWENELRTLEAKNKVNKATTKLNKELAQIDSSGTINMLEKMRTKVEEDEALAEAYGDMADMETSVDADIDKALNDPTLIAQSSLADLKRKMGLTPAEEETKIEVSQPIKEEETIRIEIEDKNAK